MARDLLPTRDIDAHKWDVGGVIVVAGSPSYPGAALLASRAAGRAGAGIVQLATGRGVIATFGGGDSGGRVRPAAGNGIVQRGAPGRRTDPGAGRESRRQS